MVCIYILPISGGSFPNQLALIGLLTKGKKLINAKIYPDVCLSSSGGNVSSYVALANNWNETSIRGYLSKIKMNVFLESWIPVLPTFLSFPFTGSFFRSGNGSEEILFLSFNKSNVQSVEIWTGTFNTVKTKAQFFCNKTKETSKLNPEYDIHMPLALSPIYLNGDIHTITKTIQASAAIPILLNSIQINDGFYSDGGIIFPSPFTVMKKSIREYMLSHPLEKLQLSYISCYNMESNNTSSFFTSLESVFHGIMLTERELCISLFLEFCPNYKIYEYTSEITFFEKIKDKHYLIICSPLFNSSINVTNFDSSQVISCFDSCVKNYKMIVYLEE